MDKAVFYHWLEQKRERIVQLICEQERQAATPDNPQAVENLQARVAVFVGNMLEFLRVNDVQVMVAHLDRVIHINFERGQKFDFKTMEQQFQAVCRAVSQVVTEGDFKAAEREQFLHQVERSMANLSSTAGTLFARAVLEQATKKAQVVS